MMTKHACWAAVAALAIAGCGENPADNVATPSEGARVNNQNPTTPRVDVPNTPRNEAAPATTTAPVGTPTAPANGATPAKADGATGANPPVVTPNPVEPTPDAKNQDTPAPGDAAPEKKQAEATKPQ